MKELLNELRLNPANRLAVMPVSRLLIDKHFKVGKYHFFPPKALDVAALNPIIDNLVEDRMSKMNVAHFTAIELRTGTAALTGFNIDILEKNTVIAFIEEISIEDFYHGSHKDYIMHLQRLINQAEKAMDVIRFNYCRVNLPDSLPGRAGSWFNSNDYLGALIYSIEQKTSYLVACDAVECSIVVKGLGLEINTSPSLNMPEPNNGEVAAVASIALSILSEAMNSPNQTSKFIRMMTLLEFLSSPDEFQGWKKIKGEIASHVAIEKSSYHKLLERFRELTSKTVDGKQIGFRTLIIHQGKALEELIPVFEDRLRLFDELQHYSGAVINDMISFGAMSWEQFQIHRDQIKVSLGVKENA